MTLQTPVVTGGGPAVQLLLQCTLRLADLLDVHRPSLDRLYAIDLMTSVEVMPSRDAEELARLLLLDAQQVRHPQIHALVSTVQRALGSLPCPVRPPLLA